MDDPVPFKMRSKRFISSFHHRLADFHNSFDLDLPLEVDDEYWEHPDPTQAFKQPAGVPCNISSFNSFLKLNQILAFALRTIVRSWAFLWGRTNLSFSFQYSINKSKILLGFVGPQWEQHIVAELDSALNKWIDTVPDHCESRPNVTE